MQLYYISVRSLGIVYSASDTWQKQLIKLNRKFVPKQRMYHINWLCCTHARVFGLYMFLIPMLVLFATRCNGLKTRFVAMLFMFILLGSSEVRQLA